MKALVTGAGGFIGSHLVERLVESGSDVTALVHYRSEGRLGWLEGFQHASCSVVAGDVNDPDAMRRIIAGHYVVFNLAALISIPHSYDSPERFLAVNAGGCLNVLNAARHHGCRVVQMSTSETYGTARALPMDEQHSINAQSPYAASKAAADQLCLAYMKSFGIDVVIARPFNTYGPRQSQRSVIPNVLAQVLRGEQSVRVGGLRFTRDFTFVTDTVRALELLAGSGESGEVYNIGSGREISIANLVRLTGKVLGVETRPKLDVHYIRPKASEVRRLLCDNSKTRKLGWEPVVDLERGLGTVADWLKPRLGDLPEGRVT